MDWMRRPDEQEEVVLPPTTPVGRCSLTSTLKVPGANLLTLKYDKLL
jgi:hypothetical protein